MFNTFNPDLWPTTFDYSEALALFKSTAPIKGRPAQAYPVRPLRRDRRYPDDHQIIWYEGDGETTVSSVVYRHDRTDTIFWYDDGRIVVDVAPRNTYRRLLETLIVGLKIETQQGHILTVNGTTLYQGGWITLRRNADGELTVADEAKGVPVYAGHKYAPAYEELGRRVRMWRKQYKTLQPSQQRHPTPFGWYNELYTKSKVRGNERFMCWTPPSTSQTAQFRLYTDGLPVNGRKVYAVRTFREVYDGILDGKISQA